MEDNLKTCKKCGSFVFTSDTLHCARCGEEREIDNTDVRGMAQNVLNVVNNVINQEQETPTTDIGKDPLLEELRNGITAEDKKLIDDAYPDTTKLIETPSCRLLVVGGVPEDANRFHVFNDERPYLSMFHGSETPRVYLPEGQWEILGRLSEITEDWCEELVTRQCINSDLVLFAYMDYVNKGYRFDNALESFHSLMQREGIYVENPIILIEKL